MVVTHDAIFNGELIREDFLTLPSLTCTESIDKLAFKIER